MKDLAECDNCGILCPEFVISETGGVCFDCMDADFYEYGDDQYDNSCYYCNGTGIGQGDINSTCKACGGLG